jgi:ATP12 chaperone protein
MQCSGCDSSSPSPCCDFRLFHFCVDCVTKRYNMRPTYSRLCAAPPSSLMAVPSFQLPACPALVQWKHGAMDISKRSGRHLLDWRPATLCSMQALGRIRQKFLQAALAEISAGRAATCGTLLRAQAHNSAAESSPDEDVKHLQRFFKTANVAAEPEVTSVCTFVMCGSRSMHVGIDDRTPTLLLAVGCDQGGYRVMLDRRALKSPAGLPLVLPSRLMALAVAAEWEQQVQLVLCTSSTSRTARTHTTTLCLSPPATAWSLFVHRCGC